MSETNNPPNLAILRGIREPSSKSELGWLLRLRPSTEFYFPEGRDSCVFTVDGYDQDRTKAAVVTVKIARRDGLVIWTGMFNNLHLNGMPAPVWA